MNPNITTLLQEIKTKTEWSEPRIAAEIGVSQPTINRILNGQGDCKGATLMAIVNLHNSLFVNAPTTTPDPANPEAIAEAEAKRNGGLRTHGDAKDRNNVSK